MSVFSPDVVITNTPLTIDGGNSNAVKTDGSATTQPVSGTISVSNFPATQPVSGTVAATQGTSPWVVSGTVSTTPSSGSSATIAQVSVTTSNITVLAANANRKKAIVMMPTVGTLYLAFGATASATIFTYKVTSNNTVIEVSNYTGAISGITASGTTLVNVTEII